MSDNVSHPSHYTQGRFGIECIEVIRREVCTLANVVKYVWRHAEKNGLEDLRKAEQYLVWAIEDGARLSSRAKALIIDHVEPVVLGTPGMVNSPYAVIVELGEDYLHTALSHLRHVISEWPTMSATLPDGSTMVKRNGRTEIEHENGRVEQVGTGDTSAFSDVAHLPRTEARSHIAGVVDGCTATLRGSEIVVEHALGCTADHEITATVPDDGVERRFVYGDAWGNEHEYYSQPPHYRLAPGSTDPTGCTATIRNGHVTIAHGGSCKADHDANECDVVTLYAGLGDREPYRTFGTVSADEPVAWQRGEHVEIVADGPSPAERARDTIERVRKGIADALGDDGFAL